MSKLDKIDKWLAIVLLAFQIGHTSGFGLKLGVNFPSMSYSDKDLDDYSSKIYGKGSYELFGEYALFSSLSVRPGIKFITRGQHIKEDGFSYKLDAKYAEFTLPLVFTFQTSSVQPYLLGGPMFGIAWGGNVSYDFNGKSYKIKINESNLRSYAFGVYLGAGLKYPLSIKEFAIVPGFEAGYHLGSSNTFNSKELSGKANALNAEGPDISGYDISGSRKNRGLELGITLSIPLSNFKKGN